MTASFVFPPNITGLYNPKSILDNSKQFQLVCDLLQLDFGCKLVRYFDFANQANKSYRLQLLEKNGNGFFVFLNKYSYCVAFSEILAPGWERWDGNSELPKNRYTDLPELETVLEEASFSVIPAHVLLLPIDADNPESAEVVRELKNKEFAEFSYYAPQYLGNIVFNNWEK